MSEKDPQGGVVPTDLDRAKEVDLISLPDGVSGTNCSNCKWFRPMRDVGRCVNPKVEMEVNERNCCALWDADGTYRAWEQTKKDVKSLRLKYRKN